MRLPASISAARWRIPASSRSGSDATMIRPQYRMAVNTIGDVSGMSVQVGDKAPHFKLVNQSKEMVELTDFSGSPTLVVFIPFPFTGVCEGELCMLRDSTSDFSELDASVVVITCDTRPANAKWAADNGFTYPILSDFWPHGETARAYGCFNESIGVADRTTYVLDGNSVVKAVISSDQFGVAREHDAYVDALAAIGS